LAYIHNFGSPAHNIPARPFLSQGVKKFMPKARQMMKQGARDALLGKGNLDALYNRIGMLARNAVVSEITNPAPPFDPLRPATIRSRMRKTAGGRRKLRTLGKIKAAAGWKAAQSNQALSEWAASGNITPLIDTGQLRASITYVVVTPGGEHLVRGKR
jgi:hypothetical protein